MAPNLRRDVIATYERFLTQGCLVAIGDGVGYPRDSLPEFEEAARRVGGVRLFLGWCHRVPVELDRTAFTDVRTFIGGSPLRRPIKNGLVRYIPVRLGTVPAVLNAGLRPDVLIASVTSTADGYFFGTEASWMPSAVEAGAQVLAELNHALPPSLTRVPTDELTIVSETEEPPLVVSPPSYQERDRELARVVAELIPAESSVQIGPGRLGRTVLEELEVPIRIDSGIVSDAVVDLDQRGLLIEEATAAYAVGSSRLYSWIRGRDVIRGLEHTHDLGRLEALPFVSVNTALQVDSFGQVNIERIGDDVIGGVGGHADYAVAASRAKTGMSILALPSERRGESTLVDRLESPTSTPRVDIDIVATENGSIDLRGFDDLERSTAIRSLWSK